MIQNFILGRRHGKTEFELVSGVADAYLATKAKMRDLIAQSGQPHPDFAEVRLYEADPERTVKFLSPEESKQQDEQRAKDEAALKAALTEKKEPKASEKPASKFKK